MKTELLKINITNMIIDLKTIAGRATVELYPLKHLGENAFYNTFINYPGVMPGGLESLK